MPAYRVCAQKGCGRLAVMNAWCWECAHETSDGTILEETIWSP